MRSAREPTGTPNQGFFSPMRAPTGMQTPLQRAVTWASGISRTEYLNDAATSDRPTVKRSAFAVTSASSRVA
jgi:hypothetical protein